MPRSEMRVETEAVAQSESTAIPPPADVMAEGSTTGANLSQGVIPQSRAEATPVVAPVLAPANPPPTAALESNPPPATTLAIAPPPAVTTASAPFPPLPSSPSRLPLKPWPRLSSHQRPFSPRRPHRPRSPPPWRRRRPRLRPRRLPDRPCHPRRTPRPHWPQPRRRAGHRAGDARRDTPSRLRPPDDDDHGRTRLFR